MKSILDVEKHKPKPRGSLIERKKNVNAHNYGHWIGVEKDLLVTELLLTSNHLLLTKTLSLPTIMKKKL